MEQQMKANSIESRPLCEKKQGSACACELHSQSHGPGQHGGTAVARSRSSAASQRHQSENAQRFLLDISGEFISRDYETTLKRLAIRAVPFLADFCFFDVLSADGTIQRVGWAHADADQARTLRLWSMRLSRLSARSTTLSARSCAPANPSLSRKSTMPGCGRSPPVSGISSSCAIWSSAR